MGMISAKVIAASSAKDRESLYTVETVSPKFLDAQIEKHRMLSSSSSSSRAVPAWKVLQQVNEDPFIPTSWREMRKVCKAIRR